MQKITIRAATPKDSQTLYHFVKELARYEKAEHCVQTSEQQLAKSLFDENTTTQALICCAQDVPIGFAIYFLNYSTWLGKNGLYLEDLYVTPEHRGEGAGKKLLQHLAGIAIAKGCGRFEWSVLDWNQPAIDFYESIGAKAQSEWIGYRLEAKALESLAKSAPTE